MLSIKHRLAHLEEGQSLGHLSVVWELLAAPEDGYYPWGVLPDPAEVEPIAQLVRGRREELGLSQRDLAETIGVLYRPTVTWNEVARWERGKRIPRAETRRALEVALDLPLHVLDRAAAAQRAVRQPAVIAPHEPTTSTNAVDALRIALIEAGTPMLEVDEVDAIPIGRLETELGQVMANYQASQFGPMLDRLPALVTASNQVGRTSARRDRRRASRLVALSNHAAAMLLPKLGELDLAWIAAQSGLRAADDSEDEAVIGSLRRSVVHTLQAHGHTDTATKVAERSADDLRSGLSAASDEGRSIYGTFLLASAMASARAGDRSGTKELLDEAATQAELLGGDANYVWTVFGPTNVAVHQVATAVAYDDIAAAERHAARLDVSTLPAERQVRFLFDLALIAIRRDRHDEALSRILEAEQIAPDHVHGHRMGQQIIHHLRGSKKGRQDPRLAELDNRTRKVQAIAGTTNVM